MKRLNQTGQWATVIAFLAIVWLAVGLLRYWRMAAVPTVISLFWFGVEIEVVQSFIPGRNASAWDVLADLAGILAGLVLMVLYACTACLCGFALLTGCDANLLN